MLGFEYGYSRDYPETLVLWEAQFGDFANGAQIIIDQFISAGEDKWGRLSGVVLLLPHGYEGQGPEHSSARIERFLQLAAEDNIQVCHAVHGRSVFPSSAPSGAESLAYTARRVHAEKHVAAPGRVIHKLGVVRVTLSGVLPERDIRSPERVLLCTGKIGHELRQERQRRNDTSTAIVFLEQLYPFPEGEISQELARHARAKEIVWVQEEPANMGALSFVLPRLRRVAQRPVRSIKRSASASPATGSAKAHALEQKTLMSLAFARNPEPRHGASRSTVGE